MFQEYRKAMRFANQKYGRAHLCHLLDECREFIQEPSVDELCDVLHTVIRLTGSTWAGFIIYPCARKFAGRYMQYGDIRSRRHLEV